MRNGSNLLRRRLFSENTIYILFYDREALKTKGNLNRNIRSEERLLAYVSEGTPALEDTHQNCEAPSGPGLAIQGPVSQSESLVNHAPIFISPSAKSSRMRPGRRPD
jgi:hypothetical protein